MILGIYGAGGLGREYFELALLINQTEQRWSKIIFIDDTKDRGFFKNIEIYPFEVVSKLYKDGEIEICIAQGEPNSKKQIRKKLEKNGYALATLISPTLHLPSSTKLGRGIVIKSGVSIGSDVIIGDNVSILANSNIGHDTILGDNCQIAPLVSISGNCVIGKDTYIGTQAAIMEKTLVGNGVIISMGACVFNDIPDGLIVMGNPARFVKNNIKNKVFK